MTDDSLFDASAGAYSTTYRLPCERSGVQNRDVGMAHAMQAPGYGGREQAIRYVLALMPGDQVTAEQVRSAVGDNAVAPGAWGSIMSDLARQGAIRRVGYVQAIRPSSNARVLALWERCAA